MRNPGSPPGKESPEVASLSALLNKMHRLSGTVAATTLRNANGVYMKLMNLRSLDPQFLAQGKSGLGAGGKLEKNVWDQFYGRTSQLSAEANEIRTAIEKADERFVAKLPSVETYVGEEGGFTIRLHKRYERDRKLIALKKAEAQKASTLRCEVCNFDFHEAYGELGSGFIEVHHTKPVHQMKASGKTLLSDLALLCANCHRMAHRKRTPLTLAELRKNRR